MRALAVSPYKGLIVEVWGADWASELATYEDYEEDKFSLHRQESALVSEYYDLMAQEEQDTDTVAYIFLQLVELRNTLAELYGYDSYADYAYAEVYCRDYAPDDAVSFEKRIPCSGNSEKPTVFLPRKDYIW